jgi:ribonuclease BN (tRNA processing enzyme)
MLPEIGVVLDAGTAMYRVREHLCTPTLDIFLSHAHLDHVVGLTFLFDVLYGRQMERVTVHGEEAKLRAVERHLFADELFPVSPPFESRPLDDRIELPGGGVLTSFPLSHPGGAVGYRIDWPDRSLAYVTDTTAESNAPYVECIRGVDLLVHECYFPDGWEEQARLTGHSCTTPVAQVAAASGVGRLILVHINPLADAEDPIGLEVARSIFPETQIGVDGMTLEF